MNHFYRKIQDKISKDLDTQDILAVLGPKQVGKTTLLKSMRRDIKVKRGEQKDVLIFDLEDSEQLNALNRDPRNFREWCLFSGADPNKDLVVMIDEIQYLQDPSGFLDWASKIDPPIKLILAGSISLSARPFSNHLPEHVKIYNLLPLDFDEFLLFKGYGDLCGIKSDACRLQSSDGKARIALRKIVPVQPQMQALFEEFVLYGGFPAVVQAGSKSEKLERLKSLTDIFEFKGVNILFNVARFDAFRSFFRMMAGCAGELLNINAVSKTLRIGRDTVQRYLAVLENSFMAHTLPPFHNGNSKELTKKKKFYFGDTGMRNLAIGNFSELRYRPDKEQLFENAIYCQLIKNLDLEDRLFFWRTISRNEVAFVVSGKHRLAFDVNTGPMVNSKRTGGFRMFNKLYPGYQNLMINLESFDNLKTNMKLEGWMV